MRAATPDARPTRIAWALDRRPRSMTEALSGLAESLESGRVDVCELIAEPERFGELGKEAQATTLERLVALEPRLEQGDVDSDSWRRVGIDAATTLGTLDAGDREWLADVLRFWRVRPRNVIDTTSPDDWIHNRGGATYYATGRTTIRRVRLAMLQTRKADVRRILDFGSGYGRILRQFKAAFPEARLAACDILPEAVDFCAETFGAEAVYAADDPGRTTLEGKFDLIWLGSLFTHLAAERWTSLLDLLEGALEPEGLLMFTTQGRFIRDQIAERTWKDAFGRPIWDNWGVTEDQLDEAVAGYDREGFGYLEWGSLERQYGTSIATPAWVMQQLQERRGFEILTYWERGWLPQDLVVCLGVGP
jgi:SAM-dependent methyltransferase